LNNGVFKLVYYYVACTELKSENTGANMAQPEQILDSALRASGVTTASIAHVDVRESLRDRHADVLLHVEISRHTFLRCAVRQVKRGNFPL
jgi:hypothetical protein